ncbi:Hypothetical predicted protein [Drosophila guanche]|uniref:MADF domain-containing protein n=1 Tax=Drosophila guanche TaxID=7266 RepID=A0A3B0KRL3_DROGU|nr:Hypothetical predicted protein [Drosophila guanche]
MPKKRRNINWKRAQVIQLLKLFQQRRILYDPKEEDYRNKGRRSLELAKSVRVLRQAMPKLSEKAVENKFGSQSAGPTVALLSQQGRVLSHTTSNAGKASAGVGAGQSSSDSSEDSDADESVFIKQEPIFDQSTIIREFLAGLGLDSFESILKNPLSD